MDEKYLGTTENPRDFIKNIKEERRKGKLPRCVNANYDKDFNEIYVYTATGRARRPLIIVENGQSKLTEEHIAKLEKGELSWQDLVDKSIIEYLDANEEEEAYVALASKYITKDHTHLEISAVTILGIITSMVPYANFVQSSRLNRGSKGQKQGLGLYASNFLLRMDTDVSVMQSPQRPIVQSFMHEITKYHKHPSGQNITIALMSYDGYNMQDAIILNQGSVQRGLARSTYFRPYSVDEMRYQGGLVDEIGVPDKEVKGYRSEEEYRLLEEDGIIYPEAKVHEEDVIIGKSSPPRFLGELEEFLEYLSKHFGVRQKITYYVIDEIKKESFLSSPETADLLIKA